MKLLSNTHMHAAQIPALLLPLLLLLSTTSTTSAKPSTGGHCPPLGAVLPAPTSPGKDPRVQSAAANFTQALTARLSATLNSTAVSVAVRSVHEPLGSPPLLDVHYTPPRLNATLGTSRVDANTVYRVGSLSKVFTALGTLLLAEEEEGVRLEDAVTKYLPELRQMGAQAGEDRNSSVVSANWDEVTIGSLLSHSSGIGSDLPADLASIPRNWSSLGLPPLAGSRNATTSTPGCGGLFGLAPCSRDELLRDLGKRHPVYAPFSGTTVYSNVAYSLLGYVIEKVANCTFDEYMTRKVLGPLGLNGSTATGEIPAGVASSKRGFVPVGPVEQHWWGVDIGYGSFAGGFYSSTNDLLTFGTSLLTSTLLPAPKTRQWLKPVSSTSSPGLLIGQPWEILRTTSATADGRLLEIYAKAGDLGGYHAKLALVPDYGLVVSVLTGGPEASFGLANKLLSDVVGAVVPAVEAAGKVEAAGRFAGRYVDSASGSWITLSVDDDGPGMKVSNWTMRGVDVLKNYAAYNGFSGGGGGAAVTPQVTARLYPAILDDGAQRYSWRVVFDVGTPEQIAAQDAMFLWEGDSCNTWGKLDRLIYGFDGLDDLVFSMDGHGVATGVEVRAFRATLKREG